MSMGLFGNRTNVWWLAAWVAATVVWGVATEAPAQRQSPAAESKASAAGGRDARPGGRRHPKRQASRNQRSLERSWNDPDTSLTPEVPGTPWTHSWQRLWPGLPRARPIG